MNLVAFYLFVCSWANYSGRAPYDCKSQEAIGRERIELGGLQEDGIYPMRKLLFACLDCEL